MLKPGDIAPDFDLPAARGTRTERVSLARIKSEMVVILFYPRDFSFICPTEVMGCQQLLGDFIAHDTQVIGVSVDDVETHLQWIRELGGLDFPLVSDQDTVLTRSYGVLNEAEAVALRATFILNTRREVLYSVASIANVGRSIHETLRVVQALHSGRLCPADWKPNVQPAEAGRS